MGVTPGEPSSAIRDRVIAARNLQHARLGNHRVNAKMAPKEIRELVQMSPECQDFMKLAASRLSLSARVFDRILKVSRTIADLAGSAEVEKIHLSEAVQYRERSEG